MTISYIVAMGRDRSIGKDNKLPWRLPADLAYFKKTTMGHPILMGRKTYDSIGRPLPGRTNVVLTRSQDFQAEGCVVVHTAEEAMERFAAEELFVTGGTEMFRLFMPYADKMYITWIDAEFEADTFFPEYDEALWRLVSEEPGVTDERNPYAYSFRVYERIK
jgi:dihydrofolate reductase